jgi:hypothetical protein
MWSLEPLLLSAISGGPVLPWLGIWVTGGLFITLSANASGGGLVGPQGVQDSLLMIVLSVIPGVTYILAAYDGSFFALLAVTVGALLLCGVRASWILLTSGSSEVQKNRGESP